MTQEIVLHIYEKDKIKILIEKILGMIENCFLIFDDH